MLRSALRDPAGRIITMVEVSGERFAGQNTSAATRALTKEQAMMRIATLRGVLWCPVLATRR